MSTEKQNVLILPELAQISVTERGIEITNEGDIIVKTKFPNASIRSLSGDIHIISTSGEKQTLGNIEALKGVVKIVGEDFEITEIRAKEVFGDVKSLQTKLIRSEGEITINRGRLQASAISAHSLHFSGTEFTGQHVGVQEDAHFTGESVQIQVVTGTHVDFQLRGTLKVSKLTAHTEAYLAARSVDIDYLSAKSLRVTPQTQGVVVCLDGPAPSEPNSIVGMLSPATFLEKIPALTGLIRELQSSQPAEKLLTSTSAGTVTEIKTSEVEVHEKEKSALLEKSPEFYRTSAEIPIPYKELAAATQQKAAQEEKQTEEQKLDSRKVEEKKTEEKKLDDKKSEKKKSEKKESEKKLEEKQESEKKEEVSANTPIFEPDLSPSGPIFEPDLAPSTPLFELPSITGLIEPIFDPNKVEDETLLPNVEVSLTPEVTEKKASTGFTGNLSPLEIPPLEEDPARSDTNPLNITNSGPIDLGLDINNSK